MDGIYTPTIRRSVYYEGRKDPFVLFKYQDYFWYEVWARFDHLCDTVYLLHDIHMDHIAELTVSKEFHQFDSGTGKVYITLLPDDNPSGKVKWNIVGKVDRMLFIK